MMPVRRPVAVIGAGPAERAAAPAAIAATAQFALLCPASAAYLTKRIGSLAARTA